MESHDGLDSPLHPLEFHSTDRSARYGLRPQVLTTHSKVSEDDIHVKTSQRT